MYDRTKIGVKKSTVPSSTYAEATVADIREKMLIPIMSSRQKVMQSAGAAMWLAACFYFWQWWLLPAHNIGTASYVLITAILVWFTLFPLYFLAIFLRGRMPIDELHLPAGSRVAMVVTKTPSEPFSVVAQTLEAMLDQDYPHETWLADEDPAEQTLAWCSARNIRVSTRKGAADYHQYTWPRRRRCKEGNLAYFYDHYGYGHYDFVVQMDADHVPADNYLREMLKPFVDTKVGYVSAPSICDKNAPQSWSARGRLNLEGTLHGLLQAGYNAGWAPLCIGSHYAVRTVALEEIGGLGPELAEDHSTSLMMNANGWRGVHAFNAIANGDGPRTFADLVTQEFQWSRSLVLILLRYSLIYVPRLPFRLKFQFLFSQFWYLLFGLLMAIMFLMPIVALITRENFVGVTFPAFFLHSFPMTLILILMAYSWKASGWCRPLGAKILSWEGTFFLFARWPWALAGSAAALRDWATGSFVDFRITPKGSDLAGPLPFRVVAPYGVLAIASALPVILMEDVNTAPGFYIYAIVNSAIYAVLLIVIVFRHAVENKLPWRTLPLHGRVQATLAICVCCLPIAATTIRGPEGLHALTWGAGGFSLTRIKYLAAGAGMGAAGKRVFHLSPGWTRNN